MNSTAVQSISLYPIKSLDRVVVEAARVLPTGALEHDREFALFDEQGNVINGKREARIHNVRVRYDLREFVVTLNESKTLHLVNNQREIEDWFGDFLGKYVSMRRNARRLSRRSGVAGPTIIGSATLREVGTWFGITDPQEISRRFRANIEVATETPFWEDRLFGDADQQRWSFG